MSDDARMAGKPRAAAAELERNNIKRFLSILAEIGSSQGQNMVLTVLFVPTLIDSGPRTALRETLTTETRTLKL